MNRKVFEKLMRKSTLDYLNVGTAETPQYVIMNGFTKIDYSPSAKVEDSAYVHDKAATYAVSGYEGSFPFDGDRIMSDEANKFLQDIGLEQKVGTDAETDFVRFDLCDEVEGQDGVYKARRYWVAVEISDFAGNAIEKQTFSGTLHQCGDFETGTFDTNTNTFTPTEAAGE